MTTKASRGEVECRIGAASDGTSVAWRKHDINLIEGRNFAEHNDKIQLVCVVCGAHVLRKICCVRSVG